MRFKIPMAAVIRIAITAILLALVIRTVDPAKIRQDLAQLEFSRIALLVTFSWIGQLFCAQRWRLFASSLGMCGSYLTFFKMYFAGMLFNVGLPSLVGGDAIKAYMVSRKSGKSLNHGFASVLQDRAVGLISLLIYGTAAIVFSPLTWKGLSLSLIYGCIWAALTAGLWVAWKGARLYRHYVIPESHTVFQTVLRLLSDFHLSLRTLRLSRWDALQVIAISFFNSGLVLWTFQQVSVAAGNPVNLVSFSALFPLIAVATMLPISIVGLGIREWAYVEGFGLLQIPADIALTIALATSALLIVSDLIGIFFLPVVPAEFRAKAE